MCWVCVSVCVCLISNGITCRECVIAEDLHGQKSRGRSEWPREGRAGTYRPTVSIPYHIFPLQTLPFTLFCCISPDPSLLSHTSTHTVWSSRFSFFKIESDTHTHIRTHTLTLSYSHMLECWYRWKQVVISYRYLWPKLQYIICTSGGHHDSTYKMYTSWGRITCASCSWFKIINLHSNTKPHFFHIFEW